MPSLEDRINQLAGERLSGKQSPESQEQGKSWLYRAPAQFNVGLAQLLGLPKVGADMLRSFAGYEEESGFPSGQEIQQFLADMGMTYKPGEEPDTIVDRTLQNLGASAIPIGGIYAKGARVASPYVSEIMASIGGATGGKILEKTDWGGENPMLARALGELGGGLTGATMTSARKIPGMVGKITPVGWVKAPYRGNWARRRAVRRLGEAANDIDFAAQQLDEMGGFDEAANLTPTQKAGDRGLAQFRKRVETDIPKEGETGIRQRSDVTQQLKQDVVSTEQGLADVRRFLENRFNQLAKEADDALSKVKSTDHPVIYNRQARDKLSQAYELARKKESQVWKNLPSGGQVDPQNIKQVYAEELDNITEGGDIKEIDQFIRQKLGKVNKKGNFVGGELIGGKKKSASPKAIHQFYSRLGRRVRELSDSSGQTNKIRILQRLRKAALDDLDTTEAGEQYRQAIQLSRDLNEKFTTGGIGRVLGFQRGQAASEAMTLDEILKSGDQAAKETVQQAIDAAPEAVDDIKNFIRTRFALSSVNDTNNRLNTKAGQKFIEKYDRVLELFPDLRDELSGASTKQAKVDELIGATDVTELSPLVKQRAATAVFLGADPGDELQRVIRQGASKGKTSQYFKDLVRQVNQDPTGKAPKGLKNALASELIEYSKKANLEDELTGESFISGRAFLKRLDDLSVPIVESGLMKKNEVARLRKIGQAFKNLETELTQKPSSQLMTDAPGRALDWLAALAGARVGARIGGGTFAGGIQTAGRTASLFTDLAQSLTNDEARNLLIRSTRDPELFRSLIKDARRMSEKQQMGLLNQIKAEAQDLGRRASQKINQTQVPASAVTPPLVHAGQESERDTGQQRLEQMIKQLRESP